MLMKYRGIVLPANGVDLVRRDDEGLAGGAQQPRQLFVERRDPRLAVHHQDEQRSLVMATCAWRRISCGISALSSGTIPPVSTISDVAPAPFGLAIDAVPGDPRLVGDDRAARPGKAVEQRGLAHIGASDDNERWQFFRHSDFELMS